MKYLSLVLFFCSAYSMDPMETNQRCKERAAKYNLFIEVMRDLERESVIADKAIRNIWPSFVKWKGMLITISEVDDYIFLDEDDFKQTP